MALTLLFVKHLGLLPWDALLVSFSPSLSQFIIWLKFLMSLCFQLYYMHHLSMGKITLNHHLSKKIMYKKDKFNLKIRCK
jgi:hypothetical protein